MSTTTPPALTSATGSVAPKPPLPLAHPEILALYARDVDRTLLRETLRLTPDQRAQKFMSFAKCADAMRGLAIPADRRAEIIAKIDARRDE